MPKRGKSLGFSKSLKNCVKNGENGLKIHETLGIFANRVLDRASGKPIVVKNHGPHHDAKD